MTVSHIAAEGMITLKSRKELTAQQSQIAEHIFERKQGEDRLRALEPAQEKRLYPLQKEYELVGKVRMGDRTGAKAILNDLLGDIFFNNAGDMELIKARVIELVVVVSRAAVESGASLDKMLNLNSQVVSQIQGLKEFEELCMGVVKVLDAMMDTLYDVRNIRNARTMALVMAYIREHYAENITLDAVAGHVYLSPYYISHLFREELGITLYHELTHHMESRGGLHALDDRDAEELAQWREELGGK
jgi:two-component system response regulator YesN